MSSTCGFQAGELVFVNYPGASYLAEFEKEMPPDECQVKWAIGIKNYNSIVPLKNLTSTEGKRNRQKTRTFLDETSAAAKAKAQAAAEANKPKDRKPQRATPKKRRRVVKKEPTSTSLGLTRAQAAAQVVAAARLEPIEDASSIKRKRNVSNKDDTNPASAPKSSPPNRNGTAAKPDHEMPDIKLPAERRSRFSHSKNDVSPNCASKYNLLPRDESSSAVTVKVKDEPVKLGSFQLQIDDNVWALVGKTEHPATVLNVNGDLIQVKWSNGITSIVERSKVKPMMLDTTDEMDHGRNRRSRRNRQILGGASAQTRGCDGPEKEESSDRASLLRSVRKASSIAASATGSARTRKASIKAAEFTSVTASTRPRKVNKKVAAFASSRGSTRPRKVRSDDESDVDSEATDAIIAAATQAGTNEESDVDSVGTDEIVAAANQFGVDTDSVSSEVTEGTSWSDITIQYTHPQIDAELQSRHIIFNSDEDFAAAVPWSQQLRLLKQLQKKMKNGPGSQTSAAASPAKAATAESSEMCAKMQTTVSIYTPREAFEICSPMCKESLDVATLDAQQDDTPSRLLSEDVDSTRTASSGPVEAKILSPSDPNESMQIAETASPENHRIILAGIDSSPRDGDDKRATADPEKLSRGFPPFAQEAFAHACL